MENINTKNDFMIEQKHQRPKIKDVARIAGVSEGTVSVVLNNRVGENVRVSETTQQKVWDAVKQLGYIANPVAQRLAGGKNHIIAVFTFEAVFPMDATSFYYPFLIGIEQEADRQGYDLLLITGSSDPVSGKRRIYENNVNRLSRADGAILLGHGDSQEIYRLLDEDFPFVYVGRRESPHDNISYVGSDYTKATKEVVEYIFQHQHRKIAYIRTNRHDESSIDRELGIKQAYREQGVEFSKDLIWSGHADQLKQQIIQEYRSSGVTAFIAEDDTIGRQILYLAETLGLKCPEDFSLAVLGNPLNPIMEVPNWTSFNIPRQQMGQEALQMLVSILQAPKSDELKLPIRKMLDCEFVAGMTVF